MRIEDGILEAGILLDAYNRAKGSNRMAEFYAKPARFNNGVGPYDWQVDFHNAGLTNVERAIIAANQIGKSDTGSGEVAFHATGRYPEWWKGRRFKRPTICVACAETNQDIRDVIQPKLLGEPDHENDRKMDGTGWIAPDLIGKPAFRNCGINDVVDYVKIRHISGGWSTIRFKSYEQGWTKFRGFQADVIWLDEEPTDFRIFIECGVRIMNRKGMLIVTVTPAMGLTDVVTHFMNGGPGIHYTNATWSKEDSPHLDEDWKRDQAARWPTHELDARTKGIPMLGEGAIFTVPDEEIMVAPFVIPPYFRQLVGIDFGLNHPFAASWGAYDADKDVVYIHDTYRIEGALPPVHCSAIKSRGDWIPVAWPHDGGSDEKSSGEELIGYYRKEKLNVLGMSARYKNKVGGRQDVEPGILDMQIRMMTGRLKVFSNQNLWFEEKRFYHRDKGKIVKKKEDLLSSTRYLLMMLRFATTPVEASYRPRMAVTGYNPLSRFRR